jgi:hypothetical protein
VPTTACDDRKGARGAHDDQAPESVKPTSDLTDSVTLVSYLTDSVQPTSIQTDSQL